MSVPFAAESNRVREAQRSTHVLSLSHEEVARVVLPSRFSDPVGDGPSTTRSGPRFRLLCHRRPVCRWPVVLLILSAFALMVPATAWGASLPDKDPETLDEAVQMVRSLNQAGVPRSDISGWLAGVLDRRIVNVNSLERMTIPANWLGAFTESAEDKAFGEWRDRNDFNYRNTAEWAWDNGLGQCSEHANTAYYILKQAGVSGNVRILTAPGHEFTVWGMRDGADPNDPTTWGPDAWVVDGWLGKALSGDDAQQNKYFKGGTTGSERPIVESTTGFDPEASPWQVAAGDTETTTGQSSPCFIATVAYGSPAAREVALLREFRDEALRPWWAGRVLIALYERVGPPLAGWVAEHNAIRAALRVVVLGPLGLSVQMTKPLWDQEGDGRPETPIINSAQRDGGS